MATSNLTQAQAKHGEEGRDTLPGVESMRKDADEWQIEWADGPHRETKLAGIAWYAREFDDEATVTLLPET